MIKVPHLETDITLACQLSCVACNHHVPLYRAMGVPPSAEPKQVEKDLNALSKILHAGAWGALGGEPTLHAKLVDILKIARFSGVADLIEVWTNGLTAQKLSAEFWKNVDFLIVSIYPGKHTEQSLDWIKKKCEDTGVKFSPRDEVNTPNFRTLFESIETGPVETQRKYEQCFFRHFSRVANNGYFYTCCCAPHMPSLVQGKPFGTDGIPIEGLTLEVLHAYLTKREPLGACVTCAGRDTAKAIPWQEQKNPVLWLRASAGAEA